MKINTSSNHKKTLIAILLLVAFVLATIFVLEKTRVTDFIKDPTYRDTSQGPTAKEVRQQEEQQAQQKADFLDKNQESQTAQVPTNSETIKLNATQDGNNVIVRNELHGQGYSSGSCELTVTNGSKSISQEAQIIYQPEYSICAGFSVPVNSIGAGNWTILLEVSPFDGDALRQSITAEVTL